MQQLSNRFAEQKIPNLLRTEAFHCLRWHQSQRHKTILVSASLEAYLVPWAKKMGFDYVIGTKLESQSGILTGRIHGKNCYGQEKVDRLRAVLGDLSKYSIYAYGDSRGDKELLDIASFAYYRKFHDAKEVELSMAQSHWERGLILSAVVAAAEPAAYLADSSLTGHYLCGLLPPLCPMALVSESHGLLCTLEK